MAVLPRPHVLLAQAETATHLLVSADVLDVFGHVAVRDPAEPDRFWLTSAMPPSRARAQDMLPYGLDGEPLEPVSVPQFSERFIHAAIFAARPDVMAICHHHAAAILPFCISEAKLFALTQTGAFLGSEVPLWDSQSAFGDTAMLVSNMAQAQDLARALGVGSAVLMRGHGMVMAGRDAADLVFKCIHGAKEATALTAAAPFGRITGLTPGEIAAVGAPAKPAVARGWAHWTALWGEQTKGAQP